MARKVQLMTAGLAILAAASLASADNTEGYSWAFAEEDWSACTAPAELTEATCEFTSRAAFCQVDADKTKAEDQELCDELLKPADEVKACADEAKTCQNDTVCSPETYTCDCTGTDFTGDLCDVATPTYVWKTTAYGECWDQAEGQTCGAQIATRTVTCVDEADETEAAVEDDKCVAEDKPAAASSEPCVEPVGTCAVNGECNATAFVCDCHNGWEGALCDKEADYHWAPAAYGECAPQLETQTCGAQVKTRSYKCVAKADETEAAVEDTFCTTAKPKDDVEEEGCEDVDVCVADNGACNPTTLTCDCANGFSGDLCADEADFLWATTETACAKTTNEQICGALQKTITPICIAKGDETKTPVDETECNADVKPEDVTTSEGCEDEEVVCGNDGTCNAELTCECVEGFEGDLCADVADFKWVFEDFGACEKQLETQTCGPQLKTRVATCRVNDETLAPAEDQTSCTTPQPQAETTNVGCEELTEVCQNSGACDDKTFECQCFNGFSGDLCEDADYYYKVGDYSACFDEDVKNTCNVTQIQTRDVTCQAIVDDSVVDEQKCVDLGITKPADQADCDTVGKCEDNSASSTGAIIVASALAVVAAFAVAF